jgi:putative ABC transport system substrate-binding protein
LRDLGYVNGQTINIDYLSADGQGERFPDLAADCVRLKADIIVVTTTPAAKAAKAATGSIPIVMYALGDPVATGLVASLNRPGGNVTGLTLMASGLAAKRLVDAWLEHSIVADRPCRRDDRMRPRMSASGTKRTSQPD